MFRKNIPSHSSVLHFYIDVETVFLRNFVVHLPLADRSPNLHVHGNPESHTVDELIKEAIIVYPVEMILEVC